MSEAADGPVCFELAYHRLHRRVIEYEIALPKALDLNFKRPSITRAGKGGEYVITKINDHITLRLVLLHGEYLAQQLRFRASDFR
jgi:hypothetical protein